jgi:hypothetical protein
MALDAMVEISARKTFAWCDPRIERLFGRPILEHNYVWLTDTVGCSRCNFTDAQKTAAVLESFDSPEGMVFIADELKRRAA